MANYDGGILDMDISLKFDKMLTKYTTNVSDLEKIVPAIERGFAKGIDELADRLKLKMIEKLGEHGLGSSKIASNIVTIPHETGIELLIGGDSEEYAMFVEYGTGIVGSENPHPKPWSYDVNGHGEEGWQYLDKNGRLRWTKGQPSRPFMYETWLWGTRSATQIVYKNIRAELKKINGVRG